MQDRVTPLHCTSETQLQASAFEQRVHHLPNGGALEQALLPEVNAPLRSSSYDYTFGPHKSPLSKGALSTSSEQLLLRRINHVVSHSCVQVMGVLGSDVGWRGSGEGIIVLVVDILIF